MVVQDRQQHEEVVHHAQREALPRAVPVVTQDLVDVGLGVGGVPGFFQAAHDVGQLLDGIRRCFGRAVVVPAHHLDVEGLVELPREGFELGPHAGQVIDLQQLDPRLDGLPRIIADVVGKGFGGALGAAEGHHDLGQLQRGILFVHGLVEGHGMGGGEGGLGPVALGGQVDVEGRHFPHRHGGLGGRRGGRARYQDRRRPHRGDEDRRGFGVQPGGGFGADGDRFEGILGHDQIAAPPPHEGAAAQQEGDKAGPRGQRPGGKSFGGRFRWRDGRRCADPRGCSRGRRRGRGGSGRGLTRRAGVEVGDLAFEELLVFLKALDLLVEFELGRDAVVDLGEGALLLADRTANGVAGGVVPWRIGQLQAQAQGHVVRAGRAGDDQAVLARRGFAASARACRLSRACRSCRSGLGTCDRVGAPRRRVCVVRGQGGRRRLEARAGRDDEALIGAAAREDIRIGHDESLDEALAPCG